MIRSQQTEDAYPDLSCFKRELERVQRERDKANLDRDGVKLERDQANLEKDQAREIRRGVISTWSGRSTSRNRRCARTRRTVSS